MVVAYIRYILVRGINMINVNWEKIKPYEKKSFAVPVTVILFAVLIASFVVSAFVPLLFKPLKFLTGLFLVLTVAFKIHIESRMLQLYMLLGIADISFMCAALIPVSKGLTVFFFVVSLIAFLLGLVLTVISEVTMKKETAYDFPEAKRDNLFAEKSVMLFAPHEDDEINLYGGVIEQYVKNGSEVKIVFLTNGDYYGLGGLRLREALNASKKYNIPAENVIFLGYSDSLKNENTLHIYNAENGELVKSRLGRGETYGIKSKAPYSQRSFTRDNIVCDIKNIITENKPDILFCCDYDSHPDHRALSLFFEEALGKILKENDEYRPCVYKGFAYSTAWDGKNDYYAPNIISTALKNPSSFMEEMKPFEWDKRVRFPVAREYLSRVMRNSSSYIAMAEYSSQTSTDHANGILNGDKVFWKRRTDSLLCSAEVASSSGNASALGSFKLAESGDITGDREPYENAWIAEDGDEMRAVAFKLKKAEKISSVVIYENPDEDSHIVNAVLQIGSVRYNTGELKPNGEPTVFEFPPVTSDYIAVKVTAFTGKCSLLKVEAFEKPESAKTEFIKLENQNGDFCYDYIVSKSGREDFFVYSYPSAENAQFEVLCDNEGVSALCENGKISVNCPLGEAAVITVRLKDNPEIYDCITVRNPDERERYIISAKQRYEQRLPSFEMLWDYYRGLIRRLAVYLK